MSDNNLVTKSDLVEFYGKILPYLNGQVPFALNQFDRSSLYSTEEKMIGQWTDSRPLYQITYISTFPSINTDKTIGTLPSNSRVVRMETVAYFANNNSLLVLPYSDNDSSHPVYVNDNKVIVYNDKSSDMSGKPVYATVQYYKTTDSPLSVRYGDTNDYSTTEQIVGTWIDSKPLYQKTVSCGALPNNASKEVSHGISNLSSCVSISGYGKVGTSSMPLPYVSNNTGSTWAIQMYVSDTKINITTIADLSSITESYVTLQYTKTT